MSLFFLDKQKAIEKLIAWRLTLVSPNYWYLCPLWLKLCLIRSR